MECNRTLEGIQQASSQGYAIHSTTSQLNAIRSLARQLQAQALAMTRQQQLQQQDAGYK
jgi:hypothetical protein